MKAGIVRFPGSNCDEDAFHAVADILGQEAVYLWHKDHDLQGVDLVILPGGFSYGDYLRAGAIARFSPIMREVVEHAKRGGLVLGICNGFQILTEMGLLPGALTRNARLHFLCEATELTVEPGRCRWLQGYSTGECITLPIAHGEGRFQCDPAQLEELQSEGQVVLRYNDNPNGSVGGVAGLCNREGNVLGLMPHPERACDPRTGGIDGRRLLASLLA